jgi:hypothetical protein
MISKKELEKRYDISFNTVRKTLEVCGLDTSRAEYTEEEINDMFDVARRMLTEDKKSYQEVYALPISTVIIAMKGIERLYLELIYPY